MGARARLASAGLCLAALGCARGPSFVESPSAFVALLRLDEKGEVLELTTAQEGFDAAQRIRLVPPTAEVLLLSLSSADVRALVPDLDPARPLELLLDSACGPGPTGDALHRDVALPASQQLRRWTVEANQEDEPIPLGDRPALRGALLRVPVAGDRCPVSSDPVLRPFGASAEAFGARATVGGLLYQRDKTWIDPFLGGFLGLVVLDERHLLAMSPSAVSLIEREVDYQGIAVTSALLPNTSTVAATDRMWAIAMYRPSPSDRPVIYVAGGLRDDRGFLRELLWDGQSLRFTDTGTVVEAALHDLAFDAAGNILAVGGRDDQRPSLGIGVAIDRSQGTKRLVELPGEPLSRVLLTGLPDQPALVGTDAASVYFGDLFAHPSRISLEPGSLDSVVGLGIEANAAGPILWASARNGPLQRRLPGAASFQRVELEIPGALADCGSAADACDRVTGFAGSPGRILLTPSAGGAITLIGALTSCTGAFAVRLSDRCVEGLTDLAAPGFKQVRGRNLNAMARFGDELFVVGSQSVVEVMKLR
ncbi:MAG: hypothetical protein U1E65_27275 [Myxococcota bacterium]